jgi:hypothetical protein
MVMILTDDVLETPKIPHVPLGFPVNGFSAFAIRDLLRSAMESYRSISTIGLLEMGRRRFVQESFPKNTDSSAVMLAEIRTCIPVDNFFHRNRDYWQAYVKMVGILLRTNGVNALITVLSQEKCAPLPSSGPEYTTSSLANLSNQMRNPMSKYV